MKSFAVSKSHRILPSMVEYARKCPSIDPENALPGMTVTACACACEQLRTPQLQAGSGAAVCQRATPVVISSAVKLPEAFAGCASRPQAATYRPPAPPAPPPANPPPPP